MNCSSCGSPLEADTSFCPNCGSAQKSEPGGDWPSSPTRDPAGITNPSNSSVPHSNWKPSPIGTDNTSDTWGLNSSSNSSQANGNADAWGKPQANGNADAWGKPQANGNADAWGKPQANGNANAWGKPQANSNADAWGKPQTDSNADAWDEPQATPQTSGPRSEIPWPNEMDLDQEKPKRLDEEELSDEDKARNAKLKSCALMGCLGLITLALVGFLGLSMLVKSHPEIADNVAKVTGAFNAGYKQGEYYNKHGGKAQPFVKGEEPDCEMRAIELFWQALILGEYQDCWRLTSSHSKKEIVNAIYDGAKGESQRSGITKKMIRSEMGAKKSILRKTFYKQLLNTVGSGVTTDSKFEVVYAEGDKQAISPEGVKKPFLVVNDKGKWRVGLVETMELAQELKAKMDK